MKLDGVRVALALGGGGARGVAHIGVVRELEKRGAHIVAIAGTSMGAVVGGIHAVGRLEDYAEWMCGLTQRDVLRLLDPSLRAPGIIGGEKVMARIRDLVGDAVIEQLPIAFTAVATDLLAGKEVWFQSGSLERAIRASIALPTVFTPVVHEERLLVDGGLLDLVPVMPLASANADLVVAVSVGGAPDPNADVSNLRPIDVMELSLQLMQRTITHYQLATLPTDVFIEMPADMCGTLEFNKAAEVIERGHLAAVAAFDD